MQQSMWVLPFNDENTGLLNALKNEIGENAGEAFLISFSVDADGEKAIIEKFNAARDEEYGEVLEQCEDFFKEIDKEIDRENFTFAEIEENEEELNKLNQWYAKICARDTFHGSLKERQKKCVECAKALDRFATKFMNGMKKA